MSFWASRLSRRSLCSTGPGGSSIAPRGLTQTVSLRAFLAPSSAHWPAQAETRCPHMRRASFPPPLRTSLRKNLCHFAFAKMGTGSDASRGGPFSGEVASRQNRVDMDAYSVLDAPGVAASQRDGDRDPTAASMLENHSVAIAQPFDR